MTVPHVDPVEAPDRRFTPCSSLTDTPQSSVEELIQTCDGCDRFYTKCCQHPFETCHHSPLVYVDGACSNNGRFGAVAGIGVAFGNSTGDVMGDETHQFSFPVDDRLDPGGYRTNQRAELLAALVGLQKICDYEEATMARRKPRSCADSSRVPIVIATDSEYVVLGMTEWLPSWKKNNFRKSGGKRPSNLDLFLSLDAEVEQRERRHKFRIQFWHIGRTYNAIADELAKLGADAAARAESEGTRAVEYTGLAYVL